jgi:peroxiredoxin
VAVAVLVARAVLAAVFALAAVTKLADRRGSREAAVGFGVPDVLAGIVVITLPLAELAVAAALLPATSATGALAGAIALLAAFSAAIGVSMARGRTPDCHCFGQLHSEPAGTRTLLRNIVLLGLAAAAFAGSLRDRGPSAVTWLGRLSGGEAAAVVFGALAVAVVTAGLVAWAVRRRPPRPRTVDPSEIGLPDGSDAPDFTLPGLDGSMVSLGELLRRGAPVLLLFTDTECTSCQALLPEIATWQREHEGTATFAIVNAGPPRRFRSAAADHGVEDVLFDEKRQVYKAYEVPGTPAAVRVEAPGTIVTRFTAGTTGVKALVESTVTGREKVYGLLPGAEIEGAIELTDAEGRRRRLDDFLGTETLFVFWDPGCGSCREIREQLLAWEADRLPGTPQLVLVTSARGDDIRGEGFSSPILLDPERTAANALGASGTPMAVLVGADGRVAWPLAIGGRHILRLIRSRAPVAA